MSLSAALAPVRRQMRASRTVTACVFLLLLIALVAIVGPLVIPHDYASTDFDKRFVAPTFDGFRLFGTDELGRDLLARTMLGVQVTFFVAVIASVVSLGIGVLYGATAGFIGGKIDAVMMRTRSTHSMRCRSYSL